MPVHRIAFLLCLLSAAPPGVVVAAAPSGHGDETGTDREISLRIQDRDRRAVVVNAVADHAADPERIFMTGGSNGGMMTFVYAVARPRRLAAIAPVVASMFTFDDVPEVPLPVLIVNGAEDREVPLDGGMSDNPLVRRAQAAPFKPVREVVDFWVRANRSQPEGTTVVDGTVTTTTHAAGPDGAVTEFVLDAAGGHGWPGTRALREGTAPIAAFSGAERVWRFFADKSRPRSE